MPATLDPTGLPFDEAILFFRQKLGLPTTSWRDLVREAHDRAFVVAGATRMRLVEDLRAAVDRALAGGTTLADFRRDFDRAVQDAGWSYKGSRGWRTRVIYQTNLTTAHAAGRYRQMTRPDVRARRPWWQYRHGGSAEPRALHVRPPSAGGWNGLVLRADDPWWQTHYPPNGWGCSCYVRTLSDDDVRRLGLEPGRAPDDGAVESVDRETGEVTETPAGVGEGWDYAPGRSVDAALGRIAAAAAARTTAPLVPVAREYVRSVLALDHFARWTAAPAGQYPVAVLDDRDRDLLGTSARLVRLSDDTMRKQLRKHPDLSAEEYRLLPTVIERGGVVRDGDAHLAYYWMGERLYGAVVKATKDRTELYVASLRRISPKNVASWKRRGTPVREPGS